MIETKNAPRTKDANEVETQSKDNTFRKKRVTFDPKDFTDESQIKDISINGEEPKIKFLSEFEKYRITKEKQIPHPAPTVKIDEASIGARGNLLGISAQIKAGKSAIKGVFISGVISESGVPDGFPTIHCEPANGKAIIDLDTEQSEADQQDNLNAILNRAGIDTTPDNLLSYNIRQLTMKDYREFTDTICTLAAEKFGGIHLISIDGGADYIASVNDEEQANEILEYFTHLSIRFDCPVIIIVHLNPNSDKERGHFGSQLQRKCFGLLTIEKAKGSDISTLTPKAFRKAGNTDVQPIHFAYDKEKRYHVQVDAPDRETEKAAVIVNKHKKIAEEVFSGQISLSYTDAVKAIMKRTNRKDRTAKEMVKDMAGWGFILRGDDGNYRLNNSEYA
ncbi:MAG: hypothetical protein ACTHNG_11375 [Ginsengibacter sp.]